MTTRWTLSRRFLALSLVLTLLTGLGLALLARQTVQTQLNQMAGSLNEDAARVLKNSLWNDISSLLDIPGVPSREMLLAETNHGVLRSRLAVLMQGSEMAKVKVYNRQGVCVFSTDPAQIGERSPDHQALRLALAGQVSSGQTHRGRFDALHGQISNVDLFQSYVPIRDGEQVLGVFEVYQNVTRIKAQADQSLQGILAVLLGVLSLMLLLQYVVVRYLDQRLKLKETALANRNAELTVALEESRQANRVKSEFISTVSHELRTPLTAINGALGLMAGGALGELPSAVREMVCMANNNGARLGHLIDDLLDMEKLMVGKLRLVMTAQPLMPLVEQALADNQPYAERHGVTFLLEQRVDWVQVAVDAQRLQQVLSNLLSNAVKYSPAGAVVELTVSEGEGTVRVSVRDDGPGIPDAFRQHVFDKFSQADASDTKLKGGTGLGLAISRELIERMGGRIGFYSVPGQGACFHFDLPCNRPETAQVPAPDNGQLPRILTVEDDADMARMLGLMLNRAGYAVDCVASGAEALERLAQRSYAAMTLDLLLPDMRGQDLIRHLRQEPTTATLPVVVISVIADEAETGLGQLGKVGIEWLAKPIDQNHLQAALNRLIAPGEHGHPRVLHVEDDRELHDVVRAMAGGRFDFELATNLREARARVALERFDVVILDLGLPNESGWDLLPEIRAQQPGTRVVVLTGGEELGENEGRVDAVLKKSQVSPQRLLDAIDVRLARDTDQKGET
ncbi:response regulator [Hydrogenophaga sp.]|uniref:ATP-binding protein n=1 Tax=Hydrogenophaga sp. TaxID=1904254 RepID=UPI002620109B|nr:response regulator [Hydrogenophaga sp.]MDM7949324.1 response regulator [Hydrogenophaga sp.]